MRSLKILFLGIVICLCTFSVHDVFAQETAKVDLLSHWWKFDFPTTTEYTLDTKTKEGILNINENSQNFTIRLNVDLKKFDGQQNIFEISDVLLVYLRRANPNMRDGQNYATYKMKDGSLPVLEAKIKLRRNEAEAVVQEMTIGYPLAMLKDNYGKHEIVLNFSGTQWTMYVDGELVDNDFPIGYPQWRGNKTWNINTKHINKAEIFMPSVKLERDLSKKNTEKPGVQYWTPIGHNAWVGDVATLYHNNRFHVFYLYDRRHHASKLGTGGHYFEHISTPDFKTWTEHKAATPIEEQWETFGTGTPFISSNKLCIAYGLHTSRIYPDHKTMYPYLKSYFENYGKTGFFDYKSLPTVPSGATYSVSQDGISNFKKSEKIIHFCENPTIYTDEHGKLTMLASFRAKGMWQTEALDGGWQCINTEFPPGGDCTFYFRWGKFDYIIGGFTDLWTKPINASNTEYKSMVGKGECFYNGFNVPAISEISDGRFLMSAWLPIRGWGGPLLIHELIQYPNGRIGTKWMKELMPEMDNATSIVSDLKGSIFHNISTESFMLSFDVVPTKEKNGVLSVSFLPDEGTENGCEFQLRLDSLRAQYSNASFERYATTEKSLREGGRPHEARNYAIENLIGIDKSFTVRIIVKYNNKFGGVLIDSEIAEQRTMITYRPDLFVKKLMFKHNDISIKNIAIAPIKQKL